MPRSKGRTDDLDLYGTMLRESMAMARYALAGGKAIPPQVAATVEAAARAAPTEPAESDPGAGVDVVAGDGPEAPPLPARAATAPNVPAVTAPNICELASAHGNLSQIVAPATPKAIVVLEKHKSDTGPLRFLGPIPLIRHLMMAALASLILFIALGLNKAVTGDVLIASSSDLPLLLNLLFLLAAAGLGASFAALFQANRFVVEGNYNPDYDPSYWIRFLLGLIAGIILAQVIPIGEVEIAAGQAAGTSGGQSIGQVGTGAELLAKPLLALLGGFAASAVYRILNRLVAAVDSIVRGDTREIVAAQEQAAKARVAEQTARSRMETAARLVALQQKLEDGRTPEDLRQHLSTLVRDVVGSEIVVNGSGRTPVVPSRPNLPQPSAGR